MRYVVINLCSAFFSEELNYIVDEVHIFAIDA